MTVESTEPTKSYPYAGVGEYDFDFLTYQNTDIWVYHTSDEGVSQVLVQNADYDVTLSTVEDGGTVDITSTTITGGVLTIRRILPVTQPISWENEDSLDMFLLERAFDSNVMVLQQQEVLVAQGAVVTNWRGLWVGPDVIYDPKDVVVAPNENWYVCTVANTSSADFDDDLAEGNWLLAVDMSVIKGHVDDAEAAATAAATSETNAATSETNAATSETNAATSEANATASASNSATSETNAAASAASLPDPHDGNVSDVITVNSTNDGWDLLPQEGGGIVPAETVQTTDFTAEAGKQYPVDTSGGDVIVTPPVTPDAGDWFQLRDVGDTWTNATACYVDGLCHSDAEGLKIDTGNGSYFIQYQDATVGWVVVDGIGEGNSPGGNITTIWTGSAANGVTVDWSGTDYTLSQFDDIRLEGIWSNDNSLCEQTLTPSRLLSIGQAIVFAYSAPGTSSSVIRLVCAAIAETNVTINNTEVGYSGVLTGIYGINYN